MNPKENQRFAYLARDNMEDVEKTGEQFKNSYEILENEKEQESKKRAEHLAPYQYKKGQSGNPSGRPKGISLKEYAKMKLVHMTDEEKEEFFNGIDKRVIWEMAEGKAEAKTDITSQGERLVFVPPVVTERFNLNESNEKTGGVSSQ